MHAETGKELPAVGQGERRRTAQARCLWRQREADGVWRYWGGEIDRSWVGCGYPDLERGDKSAL